MATSGGNLRGVNARDLLARLRFHEFIVDKDPNRLLVLSPVRRRQLYHKV